MRLLGVILITFLILIGCSTKAANMHEWNEPPTGEMLLGTIFFNIEGDEAQVKAASKFILDNFDSSVAFQQFGANFFVYCESAEQVDNDKCTGKKAVLKVIPWSAGKPNA